MSKVVDYPKLVEKWDSFIRKGALSALREDVSKLNISSIPRHHRVAIASLLRRGGCTVQGLKVLTPSVLYKDSSQRKDLKYTELSEYGVLLSEIGLTEQALQIFSKVSDDDDPKVLLYRSFCYFNQWNYSRALPLLKKYVSLERLTPYERVVGKVNLLASLVSLKRNDYASKLALEIIATTQQGKNQRLYANALELYSQVLINQGQLYQAEKQLLKAEGVLKNQSSRDALYIQKWKAFIESLKNNDPTPIANFRQNAIKQKDWESVREADYLRLRVKFNEDVFCKLFFGTQHYCYREKLINEFQVSDLADFIVIGHQPDNTFDTFYGTINGQKILPIGKKIHQVIFCLLRDLYAPMHLGVLFSSLFEDEIFNINSSPNKIHQIVSRTRAYLHENNIPLKIVEDESEYQVKYDESLNLKLYIEGDLPTGDLIHYRTLLSLNPPESFNRRYVMEKLNLPIATTTRFIQSCLEKGWLLKVGNGPKTRYQLPSSKKRLAENYKAS